MCWKLTLQVWNSFGEQIYLFMLFSVHISTGDMTYFKYHLRMSWKLLYNVWTRCVLNTVSYATFMTSLWWWCCLLEHVPECQILKEMEYKYLTFIKCIFKYVWISMFNNTNEYKIKGWDIFCISVFSIATGSLLPSYIYTTFDRDLGW